MAESLIAVRRVGVLGRLVIPDEIRERVGLESGTPINIYLDGESMIVRKIDINDIKDEKHVQQMRDVLTGLYSDVRGGKMDVEAFIKAVGQVDGEE